MTRMHIVFAALVATAGSALAQSTGGSPADPNAETNQIPAPSNTQPADPEAGSSPAARVPTDDAATGAGSGTSGNADWPVTRGDPQSESEPLAKSGPGEDVPGSPE